jgi:hypothetical protein
VFLKPDERRAKELGDAVVAALRDAVSAVNSLRDELRDENERRIAESRVATRKDHIPEAIDILRNVVDRLDALAVGQQSESKGTKKFQGRSLTVQWWLFGATAAAFIAAAIYAGIAKLQKDTMDQTYVEIAKQTTLTRMQVEGTQAAIVVCNHQFSDNRLSFNVNNRGNVTANDVTAQIVLTRRGWPDKRMRGQPRIYAIPKQPLSRDIPIAQAFSNVFPEQEWAPVSMGDQFIEVDWTCSWENGFGRKNEMSQKECIAYLAPVQVNPNTGLGFGPATMRCDYEFDETMTRFLKGRKEATAEKAKQAKQ